MKVEYAAILVMVLLGLYLCYIIKKVGFKMKKTEKEIVVYRRSLFGALVKVGAWNSRQFEARISTAGALRVNRIGKPSDGVIACFAAGEWHVCKNFVTDYGV